MWLCCVPCVVVSTVGFAFAFLFLRFIVFVYLQQQQKWMLFLLAICAFKCVSSFRCANSERFFSSSRNCKRKWKKKKSGSMCLVSDRKPKCLTLAHNRLCTFFTFCLFLPRIHPLRFDSIRLSSFMPIDTGSLFCIHDKNIQNDFVRFYLHRSMVFCALISPAYGSQCVWVYVWVCKTILRKQNSMKSPFTCTDACCALEVCLFRI